MSKKTQAKSSQQRDFSASVMDSIQNDDVKMHSSMYFAALSIFSALSVFLTSLLAAILINLTVRDVRFGRDNEFSHLGPGAETNIMASFPWTLVALAVVSVVATIWLAHKLDFTYRYRQYMLFGVIIGVISAMGIGVSVLGIDHHIEGTRPAKGLQTLKNRSREKILHGHIIEVADDYVLVEAPDGHLITVTFDENTYSRPGFVVTTGDDIVIFGDRIDEDSWYARGYGSQLGPRVKGIRRSILDGYQQGSNLQNAN